MSPPAHLIQQLVALGIPNPKASFALSEHNNDVEAAADWSFTEVRPVPPFSGLRAPRSEADSLIDDEAQGADWTPQDLLGMTFARPPTEARLETSSVPRRADYSDAPRIMAAGAKVPPHRALTAGTKVHIGQSASSDCRLETR